MRHEKPEAINLFQSRDTINVKKTKSRESVVVKFQQFNPNLITIKIHQNDGYSLLLSFIIVNKLLNS